MVRQVDSVPFRRNPEKALPLRAFVGLEELAERVGSRALIGVCIDLVDHHGIQVAEDMYSHHDDLSLIVAVLKIAYVQRNNDNGNDDLQTTFGS